MKDIILKFGNVTVADVFDFATGTPPSGAKIDADIQSAESRDDIVPCKIVIKCPTNTDRAYHKKFTVPSVKKWFKDQNKEYRRKLKKIPAIYFAGNV